MATIERRTQDHTWSDDPNRTRVLLECAPHDTPGLIADVLGREGMDVVVCTGPVGGVSCPMLCGQPCPLVDGADVVLNLLGDHDGRAIASAVLAERRPPAVVYEVRHAVTQRHGDPPAGATVVHTPVTRESLLAAIAVAAPPQTSGDRVSRGAVNDGPGARPRPAPGSGPGVADR